MRSPISRARRVGACSRERSGANRFRERMRGRDTKQQDFRKSAERHSAWRPHRRRYGHDLRLLVKIVSSRVTERQHLSTTRALFLYLSFSLFLSFLSGYRSPSFFRSYRPSRFRDKVASPRAVHATESSYRSGGDGDGDGDEERDGWIVSLKGAKKDYIAKRGRIS